MIESNNYIMDTELDSLGEMQTTFLLSKLTRLNAWNACRNELENKIIAKVNNPLKDISLSSGGDYYNVWHIFDVICKCCNKLEKYLNGAGIVINKHYSKSIYREEAYKCLDLKDSTRQMAEMIFACVLSVFVYYGMLDCKVDYLINKLNNFEVKL